MSVFNYFGLGMSSLLLWDPGDFMQMFSDVASNRYVTSNAQFTVATFYVNVFKCSFTSALFTVVKLSLALTPL